MAKLQPKDKVEWRAGSSPSTSRIRQGVVKEIVDEGRICLVRTKVEGINVIEEIRTARLTKVDEPKPARKKRKKRKKGKKAPSNKAKKRASKKAKTSD